MNVPIDSAEVDVRGYFPQEGKLDVGDDDGGMEELTLTIKVQSPAPRDEVLKMVQRADRTCHVASSLRNPVPVRALLQYNDEDADVPVSGPG
jgi:organic hydroperoxide reductase OsmC/OhrA